MMIKRKYLLIFPEETVEKPITYNLIHDYNLMINILKASVTPGKEGRLVIEVQGDKKALANAKLYLKEIGVNIKPVIEGIRWLKERCVHCTACVPGCPSQCFVVDRKTMVISFEKEKCIVCKHCLSACAYGAIKILENNAG
ncbi:MAG: hypothetical protein AMJ45_06225 [Syntrophobacter sp. DG_60]|nr:MAG: hypothetical protein AMJ45_06225 [Syntrophobacter sp. DG_60]